MRDFDFYSLFELAKLKAINLALNPSVDSIWRIRAREYSVKFHTPLHIVLNELDPLFVLQQLNEDLFPPGIVQDECEELLTILYKMKDPNYDPLNKEETEELVDMVLNREIARLSKKKRPTQETIQREIKTAESKPKPKSGGMTFSELDSLESKAEHNSSGEF